MKKLLCLFLVTILMLAFSACSNEKASTGNVKTSSEAKTSNDIEKSSKIQTPSNIQTPSKAQAPIKTQTPSKRQTPSKSQTANKIKVNDKKLGDLHNAIQSKNPAPVVKEDFKPLIDTGFSEGNGTQTNPYIIKTAAQLVYFSEKINKGEMNGGAYFALGADIDMTGVKFSPIGNSAHRFSSNFDGRGFTVSNLTPKLIYEDLGYNANYSCGFFGIVENAEIKNLHLENINITYSFESDYFTEIGLLAACVYPTRECKITDCIVNGSINVETEVLLAGGIVGDIFVTNGARLEFKRLQSNTKLQVHSDSVNAGAISGSFLGRGVENFSDIFVQSQILNNSMYSSYIGAFGGVSNSTGSMNVSNCFIKINTNKKLDDQIHPLIGGIIDSYEPSGRFNFTNVFGFADGCSELYEILSKNLVKEVNCGVTDVLPTNCNFNAQIWDISNPSAPFIKFNF